jgi:dipeptidyl aminopeptidase/acylaminoacyl peptidase
VLVARSARSLALAAAAALIAATAGAAIPAISAVPAQAATAVRSDSAPAYAPDGTLVYVRAIPGSWQLRTIGRDAADNLLYRSTSRIADPSWSPDSRRVVMALGTDRERSRLYLLAADGSDRRWLTRDPAGETVPTADAGPTWSPDGLTIAFTRRAGGASTLWTVNTAGAPHPRPLR